MQVSVEHDDAEGQDESGVSGRENGRVLSPTNPSGKTVGQKVTGRNKRGTRIHRGRRVNHPDICALLSSSIDVAHLCGEHASNAEVWEMGVITLCHATKFYT